MADILPFKRPASAKKKQKPTKGNTLCKSGFHKWQADKKTQFDVKQGQLVSRWVCSRCGKTKVEVK